MNRLRPLMNGWSTTAIPFWLLFSAKYSTRPITGTNEYIYNLIKEKKIVVFMKGTPDAPNCGFSNAVVQILKFHGVNNYDSYNVLEDESLRQGIKDYSQWPTIPQVYINGDFIGGCDVMLEMHKNGDLIEELKKAGLRSALLDK